MSIRIIADENISWRLKKLLPTWEVLPANEISKLRLSDTNIWRFAKDNKYSVLTFDEDFSDIQNLSGFPPKIIWLRTGNISTAEIAQVLLEIEEEIVKFLSEESLGVYEIYL